MLQHYNFTHFPYLNYKLDEVQTRFTAEVPVALERIAQRQLNGDYEGKPVTIFHNGTPAGFFILDFGADKLELSDNPYAVLVRSLSINPKFQGKGIGKSAMDLIPDFLRKYFPKTDEIVLAVNEANTSAFRLYEKCGYLFEGKTRMGRSGKQYLMRRDI